MKTEECVCVWFDWYSSPNDRGWVVSRDEIDVRGRAATTVTVYSCDDITDAIEYDIGLGEKLGLPVYRNQEGEAPLLLSCRLPGREKKMKTYYTLIGSVRGSCGHRHRSLRTAKKCYRLDEYEHRDFCEA